MEAVIQLNSNKSHQICPLNQKISQSMLVISSNLEQSSDQIISPRDFNAVFE